MLGEDNAKTVEIRQSEGGNVVFIPSRSSDPTVREMEAAGDESQGDISTGGDRVLEPTDADTKTCFLMVYLRRLRGAGETGPPFFALSLDFIPSFVFSTGIMTVLEVVDWYALAPYGLEVYLPSFGASCAMTVCLLSAPGAQPQGLLATHFLGALLGLSFGHATKLVGQPLGHLLAAAFSVAVLTPICLLFGWFQPASSATAVLAAFHEYGLRHDENYLFLATPVLLGGAIIFLLSWILNNLIPWRPAYPVWL